MLLTANFKGQRIPLMPSLFHETKTDFDMEWYKTNGFNITKAMMINALLGPIIELVMGLIRIIKR